MEAWPEWVLLVTEVRDMPAKNGSAIRQLILNAITLTASNSFVSTHYNH
jgi:hypothetical protein